MYSITALATIGAILIAIFLPIGAWKIQRLKPKLSIEVVACRHGLRGDGRAFLLRTEHLVANSGRKNTHINSLEAHFVDAQNSFQSQTVALSIDVAAGTSTLPLKALFAFAPPFPYTPSFEVHFILYHTQGREVFAANSTQSDLQSQLQ